MEMYYIEDDAILEEFAKLSPTDRLIWLEDICDFIWTAWMNDKDYIGRYFRVREFENENKIISV